MMTLKEIQEISVELTDILDRFTKELQEVDDLLQRRKSDENLAPLIKRKQEKLMRVGNMIAESVHQISEYGVRHAY